MLNRTEEHLEETANNRKVTVIGRMFARMALDDLAAGTHQLLDIAREGDNAPVSSSVSPLCGSVDDKAAGYTEVLKSRGKYAPEYDEQIRQAAMLVVRRDIIFSEITSDGYQIVKSECSREGDAREKVNPKERLFLDYSERAQKALQALGMNTDSRERKTNDDGFGDFMEQFKRDDE